MDIPQVLSIIIGSGGIIGSICVLIGERLKRRDTLADKTEGTDGKVEKLSLRVDKIDSKVDSIADDMKQVIWITKAQAYDRIRHLGLSYIKAGFISADELRNYVDMQKSYQDFEPDAFLQRLMEEVNKLKIVPNLTEGGNDDE